MSDASDWCTVFTFISCMVDMPQECERCRLQLTIEYNRLLAWGDAVGLVDVPDGAHVASCLGTNAVELCSIMARIGWLLEEFKDINSRWEGEVQRSQAHRPSATEDQARRIDVSQQVSSLAAQYQRNRAAKSYLTRVDRVARWISRGDRSRWTKPLLRECWRTFIA